MGNPLWEVRHAARRLRKPIGFTTVAAITLGLGIGATTAIFSVVNAVLIRPLPFPESDALVSLGHESLASGETQRIGLADGTYLVYRDASRSLESAAAYVPATVNLTLPEGPERVVAGVATHTLFSTLQVLPVLGRVFTAEDDRPGAPPVVILNHNFWTSHFGSEADVLGKTLTLNEVEREIIGVMPEGFRFPDETTELWVPLQIDPTKARAVGFYLSGLGRLAEGVTVEQATAELETLFPRSFERFSGEVAYEEIRSLGFHASVRPLKEVVVGNVGSVLWVLLAAVGLILLIACGNVANLVLVRSEGRYREVALLSALGASRGQLARHFLIESTLLGVVGGVVGLGLAYVGLNVLLALAPAQLPRLNEVGLDGTVLGFAATIALLSGLVFGLFPVLRLRRDETLEGLRDGGRGASYGRGPNRVRKALVMSQLALALILLTGSGLMFRTFWNLRSVDPGFRTDNLLTFGLLLTGSEYASYDARTEFHQLVLDRLEQLPGVESASGGPYAFGLPIQSSPNPNPIWLEDFPTPPGSWPEMHAIRIVMPDYFHTLEIPILEGRPIERRDIEQGTGAAVVSETFARRYWGDESPIGKRINSGPPQGGPWYTVVGVAGDIRVGGLREDPVSVVYWGLKGAGGRYYTGNAALRYALRTTGAPASVLPAVRRAIRELDPNLPLDAVLTMEETLSRSMARTAFTIALLGVAACMALLLGTVGVYGVMAYVVSQRTREIGVRMALGARARGIANMVLRQGAGVIAAGMGFGLLGAFGVTRLLRSLLFGVGPVDAATYASVSILLAAVALFASYLPARRAARVEPMVALRHE